MDLVQQLQTVIGSLRSGRLEGEEGVKLAVLLPILHALGWNYADPGSFKPEYSAGPGRVDYALLCHGRPQVFIEAKRRGGLNVRAEEQLFRYASNNGVPLLVLTDGSLWDFYLSMADGPPEMRRFCRLELRDEDRLSEYASVLESYLHRQCIASGEARRKAEKCLESSRDRKSARAAIPDAWNALLNEPDELLCDLLASKVHDESGINPDPDDLREFLTSLSSVPKGLPPMHRSPMDQRSVPNMEGSSRRVSGLRTSTPPLVEVGRTKMTELSSQLLPGESKGEESRESLQGIVYDLMRIALEIYPSLLDKETISYLENTKNPVGTKLAYPLIRSISKGRCIGKYSRYKRTIYAGRWHVCTEWNKTHHPHNAERLAEWVTSLTASTDDLEARESLAGIRERLSIWAENTKPHR